ncbi:hypothetical protein EGW08_012817 [Elysia chlorotica]|uniref:SH3 domain-binding protein 5-like n=1 Tax=Elysia chlorotica TaxID=188477 RepID=A0A433TD89_ELYCH|nr:hypothetical protein EGW08_012817 [Elysia chlorotica]
MSVTQAHLSKREDIEEPLDPRVQTELEILNQCSSDVNRLEREIDEARSKYQQNFASCSQQLERLKKNFGRSIKKARPYYELKEKAREAQSEALRSARKFQSANGIYLAAKETISLAELRLMDDKAASLSSAWQEMLNHALMRVTEAERTKTASEKEHLARSAAFAEIEQQMCSLEKSQKRSIARARQYFEKKKELEVKLQQVKQSIQDLQQAMVAAKARYSGALRRLETISDCIHEQRRQKLVLMYPREPGVGAEENEWTEQRLPSLTSCDDDGSENFEDPYEYEDDYDDDYNGIDSESIFRTKVLTTALDEEDTSKVKGNRGKKKLLKRSQSLPGDTAQLARRYRDVQVLSPLSDREESCPPDGESVGSGDSVGACSMSSVSSQGGSALSEQQQELENTHVLLDKSLSEPSSSNIDVSRSNHPCSSHITDSESFNNLASDINAIQSSNREQVVSTSHMSQTCNSRVSESETSHPKPDESTSSSPLNSSEENSAIPSHETPNLEASTLPKKDRSETLNAEDTELHLSSS